MGAILSQVFPFVHPGLAAAALAMGLIPILVHLVNRRRYVRLPWAAMKFLLAAHRRSARRVRLEQWLLLLTRVSLIVLVGFALARPYLPGSFILPFPSARVHRVLLVDNSLSMKAKTEDGQSRFELARSYAEALLESLPRTDAVSVVTLADPAEAVIAQAAYDRRFVRERLAAIEVTQRATDTVGAIGLTLEIIEDSPLPAGNQVVYIISDFPEYIWASATPVNPTPAVRMTRQLADTLVDSSSDLVLFIAASARRPIENLSIASLTTGSSLTAVGFPVELIVDIENHNAMSVPDASLQIRRDGEIIRQEPLPRLQPQKATRAVITTAFGTPGTHLIEARVSPTAGGLASEDWDALADDDFRYLSIDIHTTSPILLVDGRPGGSAPAAGQTGYLAMALAPQQRQLGPRQAGWPAVLAPKVITESELGGEVLADYDAVMLCNVQRLPKEIWNRLERFVDQGGGLMVFGGDLVSADNYNRFGYADGAGVLPGRIGDPRPGGLWSSKRDTWVQFKGDGLEHPIVAEFAEVAESGLFSARIQNYLPLEPESGKADTVLRYTNDDPALVASSFGAGRVLLCTTTANMDWTNLPARGDYVSLMLNAVAYLSPTRGQHRNVMVGGVFREPLTPIESSMSLRVTSSDGVVSQPSLVPYASGLALEYGPIERAGAATVSIGPTVRTFTANVDVDESRLAHMDAERLTRLIDRPLEVIDAPPRRVPARVVPARGRSAELSSILFYLVVGLLFAEMTLAMWFGTRSTQESPARRRSGSRASRTVFARRRA